MIAEINRDQAPAEYYDIIVIGGGAAGIAAVRADAAPVRS